MSNTSATGGYLLPAGFPTPPGELTLKQFLQTVFVGISGLSPDLVRPRWQRNPPKQPDIGVDWLAIGVTTTRPDAYAFVGTLASTQASGFIKLVCCPEPGATVVVNGVTITFVKGVPSGDQVQIADTLADTAKNLQSFLSASSNVNLNVATYTVFANAVSVIFTAAGPAGNSFTLSSTAKSVFIKYPTLTGGGTNTNLLQRHEDIEIQCAFYGDNAQDISALVRDGFQITQNLESLRLANIGFTTCGDLIHAPDLVNERWVEKYEMSVFIKREIQRSYQVLNFVSVNGLLESDNVSGNLKTVAFSAGA